MENYRWKVIGICLLLIFGIAFYTHFFMGNEVNNANAQTAPQPTQIEVTNNAKEYEGVIVEGPKYLANTLIAVVGVEVEVNGYKVVKPALITNFTYEEMTALKEFKIKMKIRAVDIQKAGESPLIVWVVQK